MKRIILLAVMAWVWVGTVLFAGYVKVEDARIVARNWLAHHVLMYESWADSTSPKILKEEVLEVEGQVVGYNFLIAPAGHVLVPARDEMPAVKLYSDTRTLSLGDDSDIAKWVKEIELLRVYRALAELEGVDFSATPNGRMWGLFVQDAENFIPMYKYRTALAKAVSLAPLISSTWGQTDPYWLQTPKWYTGTRTVTGCVATAAAQIMRYWNHPAKGQGSTSYTWYNGAANVTLSRDFSTRTYSWNNMTDAYGSGSGDSQRNAVAKLMADVGIAFHMYYGTSASSASTGYGTTVYPTYFDYKSSIQYVQRASYASDSAWMKVFKSEVRAGRPCQFRASDDGGAGGHSMVVDGYRDTPAEQIHINLGWNGSYNGWYVSNNIAAGGYDFNTDQAALIGIAPSAASGFNSQFNGSTAGWTAVKGWWGILDGTFFYSNGKANYGASTKYSAGTFAKLDFKVRMLRSEGGDTLANRIIIRGTPLPLDNTGWWNDAYYFQYTREGSISVWKCINGVSSALLDWTSSSAVNQGSAWNTLRVVANGTSLRFFVNGTLVWSGSDADLQSGKVGIGFYRDDIASKLKVDWAALATD